MERDQNAQGAGMKATPKRHKAATKATRPSQPKRPSERTSRPRDKPKAAKINPDETTKADLVARAKKAGVSGYSHMSKADLAHAISRAK
jgi:hypothetical protein